MRNKYFLEYKQGILKIGYKLIFDCSYVFWKVEVFYILYLLLEYISFNFYIIYILFFSYKKNLYIDIINFIKIFTILF